jgi:hypothetical protein
MAWYVITDRLNKLSFVSGKVMNNLINFELWDSNCTMHKAFYHNIKDNKDCQYSICASRKYMQKFLQTEYSETFSMSLVI